MSDTVYFEEPEKMSQEHAGVVISQEGFDIPFSPPINDNKLPRALLVRRFVVGGCLAAAGGIILYCFM